MNQQELLELLPGTITENGGICALRNMHLNDENIATLASWLAGYPKVHSLDLMGNEIGPEGAKILATLMEQRGNIVSINLDNNHLGDDGVGFLADSLTRNRILKNLDLKNNGVTAIGATGLANALAKNQTLQTLSLSQNNVGDATTLLAAIVQTRMYFQELRLNQSNVSSEGAQALIHAQ